ncbi:MAG: hypothetical protein R3C49_19395 [Planctomycetaceae bacterium]
MMTVMSVSSLQAADGETSNSLLGLFKGPSIGRPQQSNKTGSAPSGVTHAVVVDVDRQIPEVRQTSSEPSKTALQPAESAPQPTPYPVSPNNQVRSFEATESTQPFQFASGPTSGSINATQVGFGIPHRPMVYEYPGMDGGYSGSGPGPLYPCPVPGIPQQIGGSAIVHQAFHPHEMLYAHRYKSMYGPYYYKVHGGWVVTPFGVWSKENWKLQGTTVDVKYKSHISPFAMFHRPIIDMH